MTQTFLSRRLLPLFLLGAAALAASMAASAQPGAPRAHTHGRAELTVAVDGPAIMIAMVAPLDSLLGFERPPRTDVEKNLVEQLTARLRAADHLFSIDPAAGCKLGPVQLEAPALGLGKGSAAKDEPHAELNASFAFNCANAPKASFIDTDLFAAFPNLRQIEVAIATPEGPARRSLKRPAARIGWGR